MQVLCSDLHDRKHFRGLAPQDMARKMHRQKNTDNSTETYLSVTLSVYATSLLHPLTSLSHPVLHSQAASGSVMPCAPDYDMQFPQNLHTMQPLFPLEDELSYNLTGAFLILIFPFLL